MEKCLHSARLRVNNPKRRVTTTGHTQYLREQGNYDSRLLPFRTIIVSSLSLSPFPSCHANSAITSGMLIGKWRCDLWNLNWNDTNFWHSDMQLKLNLQSSGFRILYLPFLSHSCHVMSSCVDSSWMVVDLYTSASTSSWRVYYEIYSFSVLCRTSKNECSVVYLSSSYFSHLVGDWIGGGEKRMDCREIVDLLNDLTVYVIGKFHFSLSIFD